MKVCKPLHLEHVRRSLRDGNVTLKKMGILVPTYVPQCEYMQIQESRIQDWEFGRRSVPEYVFYAYAAIAIDDWAGDRHVAPESSHMKIDFRYGSMFTPGFGELLKLEHLAMRSADSELKVILPNLALQVKSWKQYFKDILGVDMEKVWA